ncbi:hypothetical protein GS881_24600 [Rhodococcus hoagii]|nr:hypothetical protein [Prescottella equi]
MARFYGARARRLLPAGTLVLVVTAIGAALILPPLQHASPCATGSPPRCTSATTGSRPPAPTTSPRMLPRLRFQHYWSLGVEEQFYLLWPALIVGTAWLVRRRRHDRSPSVLPFLSALVAVAVASVAASSVWTDTRPPWAFFALPARAWELAAGGMSRSSVPLWRRLPRRAAAVAGWRVWR